MQLSTVDVDFRKSDLISQDESMLCEAFDTCEMKVMTQTVIH